VPACLLCLLSSLRVSLPCLRTFPFVFWCPFLIFGVLCLSNWLSLMYSCLQSFSAGSEWGVEGGCGMACQARQAACRHLGLVAGQEVEALKAVAWRAGIAQLEQQAYESQDGTITDERGRVVKKKCGLMNELADVC